MGQKSKGMCVSEREKGVKRDRIGGKSIKRFNMAKKVNWMRERKLGVRFFRKMTNGVSSLL